MHNLFHKTEAFIGSAVFLLGCAVTRWVYKFWSKCFWSNVNTQIKIKCDSFDKRLNDVEIENILNREQHKTTNDNIERMQNTIDKVLDNQVTKDDIENLKIFIKDHA